MYTVSKKQQAVFTGVITDFDQQRETGFWLDYFSFVLPKVLI